MKTKRILKSGWLNLTILILVGGFVLFLLTSCSRQPVQDEIAVTIPTITPEQLLPTRTPVLKEIEKSAVPLSDTATPSTQESEELILSPTETPTDAPAEAAVGEQSGEPGKSDLARFGVTGGLASAQIAYNDGMPFSHLLNWHVEINPPQQEVTFWQMVRLREEGLYGTTWEVIEEAIGANPGANWLVGNEPDVIWQDNVTPERYAELYHEVYSFIKERDPEAQLVIGGVSQPTPLRRAYLDIVLESYQAQYGQPMPIDIWNVHAFTLREEANSWGVDIPPGMEGQAGILYEIEDHNDVEILRQNLIDFRAWMSDRGYDNKPLVISEYGILMPEDYGFSTEVLGKFMIETFELFLTETNETGYIPDENRLVQWWFWYTVYEKEYYPTGNLYDVPEERLTPIGEIWTDYLENLSVN